MDNKLFIKKRRLFGRVRKIAQKIRPSGRMQQRGSHWTEFDDILYLRFFQKFVENIQLLFNLTRVSGTLYENVCTFMTISHLILLKNRHVSDKVVEKIKTHILHSITFFSKNRAIYEIMWRHTGHR